MHKLNLPNYFAHFTSYCLHKSGNLGRVDFITESEYDLYIRPDTCNPRARFWFHFSVDNVQKDQRVLFHVVNLGRTRSLFKDGMTPVVKSTSRPRWQRLKSEQVYYYTSPEHSRNSVLSMAFAFDREDEIYSFALTFPYSYTRTMAAVKRLSRRKGPHSEEIVALQAIARSIVSDLRTSVLLQMKINLYLMLKAHPCICI